MIDDRLRALERSTDPGDEVARVRLLLERVRAGVLSPDRLRLAAEAGSADARRALGWPEGGELGFLIFDPLARWRGGDWQVDASVAPRDRLHLWVRRLAAIDREAGLVAMLAAARRTLELESSPEAFARVLEVAAWAADRTETKREAIDRGRLGRVIEWPCMLAITARRWDDSRSGDEPPTGARTVAKCAERLSKVGLEGERLIETAVSLAVSVWALRSETPGSLPSGEAPEVRTR